MAACKGGLVVFAALWVAACSAGSGGSDDRRESPAPRWPADLLPLANWKLTLPVDTKHQGEPDEITQPDLATFSIAPYFQLNSAADGVDFRAPCGGVPTSGSSYPRSELREMTNEGADTASWSTTSGKHTMVLRQAILHTPLAKPDVTVAQIHDTSDHPFAVVLQGKKLTVVANGSTVGVIDPNYELGTTYSLSFIASAGRVVVLYNDKQVLDQSFASTGCYFKAGCYTLSNPSQGDATSSYGETTIFDLKVEHQPQ